MLRFVFCVLACAAAFASNAAWAQDSLVSEMYGRGVHAFHAGNLTGAFDNLSSAVDQGSKDPRTFYYRGLVQMRMGREDEAKADFTRGAELEAGAASLGINIGRSLERVQGSERLVLEDFRRLARVDLKQRDEQRKKERYEAFIDTQKRVSKSVGPAAVPANVPAAAVVDAADPFGAAPDAAQPSKTIEAASPKAAGDDPFGAAPAAATTEPAAGATEPAAADPFGGPPAAAEKPAAAADAADPFGGAVTEKPAPAPAAEADPFGGAAAPAPAAGDKPAAAPDAADPFGAPAEKMDDKKPAPAAEADPFGAAAAAAPAEKPAAAADPLGGAAAPAAKPAGKKSLLGALFGAGGKALDKSTGGDGKIFEGPGAMPAGGAPGEAMPDEAAPPAAGVDPLGDLSPAPKPAAAGAKPAAGDPFMDEPEMKKPAAKPAADDPFKE